MDSAGLLKLDRESVTVWPCLRESALGDWVLRFGGGVYGRSNSVQPYGSPGRPLDEAIDECEAAYLAEDIRPMFRLPDFLGLDSLDQKLASRGYELGEPTEVLVGPTAGFSSAHDVLSANHPDEAWLDSYMRGSGRGAGRRPVVAELMSRVAAPRCFARIEVDGEIACNGLAVVLNGTVWLFGIATVPEYRRQGLALRLVSALLAWGREQGADHSALQVSTGNVGAVQLYVGMGLAKIYGYHYRRL